MSLIRKLILVGILLIIQACGQKGALSSKLLSAPQMHSKKELRNLSFDRLLVGAERIKDNKLLKENIR